MPTSPMERINTNAEQWAEDKRCAYPNFLCITQWNNPFDIE